MSARHTSQKLLPDRDIATRLLALLLAVVATLGSSAVEAAEQDEVQPR